MASWGEDGDKKRHLADRRVAPNESYFPERRGKESLYEKELSRNLAIRGLGQAAVDPEVEELLDKLDSGEDTK